ncbi:MAG: Loki-CTERM sorting domain-containing protein [Promethearchaeota archaeon]
MTLINLPSFPSESQSIPSFQISTIFGVIMIATLISIIKTKKKKKNYKNLN